MKTDCNDSVSLSISNGSEVAFKALIEMMERPFAALGKKRRFKPIKYETRNIEILITAPQPWGIATIYDMDIMMWIASRIIEEKDKGNKTSPIVEFTPYECLTSIGRSGLGGRGYQLFIDAIKRLFHTRIITTIREEDQYLIKGKKYSREQVKGFHWIEDYEIKQEETKSGKKVIRGIKIVLSNWFYLAIVKHNSILQIADDYFFLKSGLDRVLYLIARKHVGRQKYWSFPVRILYEKTGSDDRYSNFVIQLKKAIKRNALPEYVMMYEKKGENRKEDTVHFYRRNDLSPKNPMWEPKRINGKLTSGIIEKSLLE